MNYTYTTLNQAALDHFAEYGFVVIANVFDPEQDFQPLIEEYNGVLDTLSEQLHAEGKLTSTYRDLPLGKRFMQITTETGELHAQPFDISLPQAGVSETTPIHCGEAIFALLRHPRLLDLVETFIGPEIYSNPVQHSRFKVPLSSMPQGQWDGLTGTIGLHQDQGVGLPEADDSEILTVWFPITDATEQNGCLQVIPKSHVIGLHDHCPSSTNGVHIPDQRLPELSPVPLPMKSGSILFMTRKTIHGSLANVSDDIRWSVDLRYNPIGQATGRPNFPGFIARSKKHPEHVLSDAKRWAQLWHEARDSIAQQNNPVFNRWATDSELCA